MLGPLNMRPKRALIISLVFGVHCLLGSLKEQVQRLHQNAF